MTMGDPRTRHERGSLLILTLLVSAALVFFAMAFFSLYNGNKVIQMQAEARLVAEGAASGGIEDAICQLKKDATWTAGFTAVRLAHSGATYSMTFAPGTAELPWSKNNIASSAAVTGYGGRTVPPGTAHLVCVGVYQNVAVTEEALIARTAVSPFQFGLFGAEQLVLQNGAMTDGYNSAAGSYSITKSSTAGAVATNATQPGSIQLRNKVVVGGDVTVGPGGTASVVSGTGTYHALQVPLSPVPVTPPVAPDGTAGTGSQTSTRRRGWSHGHGQWWSQGNTSTTNIVNRQGDVHVTGDATLQPGVYDDLTISGRGTLTLSAGTYVFSTMHIDGTAFKLASGPVTVYFTGDMQVDNNTQINAGGAPADLTLLGTGSVKNINFGHDTVGAFGLYAPTAELKAGQGCEFYGSLAARTLDLDNGACLHFDQALAGGSGANGSGPWTVLSRW